MSITRQPCRRKDGKCIAFLVSLDKKQAVILDNLVWAVATKTLPIAVWRKEWVKLQVPEEKQDRILKGLVQYAVYAGITPEAAEYLKQLTPVEAYVLKVAIHKGEETLARFKTQAAAEEAAEKHGKKLTGAALASVVKKELEKAGLEHATTVSTESVESEPPLEDDYFGQPPRDTVEEKHLSTDKAKTAKRLAREVTADLNAAEARGENPMKILNAPKQRQPKQKRQPSKTPFDAAKLKGPDGEYKSVSAMLKGLLIENETRKKPLTDDQIFAAVQKKFGLGDDKRGYVGWNRNWLKKEKVIA